MYRLIRKIEGLNYSVYGALGLSPLDFVTSNQFNHYNFIKRTSQHNIVTNFSNIDNVVNHIKTIEGY